MTDAVQATVTKFLSLADGTLRLQVDVHHGDTSKALDLLCKVGATVAVARLVEEQTEQQRYDSVTTTGSGRQVSEEPESLSKDPLVGKIMSGFYINGFFHGPQVLAALGTDAEFLTWLLPQPCAHCGEGGPEGVEVVAAHVRRVSAGAGTARKPPFSAIPLCTTCHSIQHAVGESGLAPPEWWESKAAKAREEWGHQKLREVFATDSISAGVHVDELWAWLRTNDLLTFVSTKVRRDVEQRQRDAASGSAGGVGEAAVVER